jgi:hypothetical protein
VGTAAWFEVWFNVRVLDGRRVQDSVVGLVRRAPVVEVEQSTRPFAALDRRVAAAGRIAASRKV